MTQSNQQNHYLKPKTIDELLDCEPDKLVTQAERIICKFGGVPRFTELLNSVGYTINKTNVYKWLKPSHNPNAKDQSRKHGLDGYLPTSVIPYLDVIARLDGVTLTSEDIDPRPQKKRVVIE